MCLLSHDWVYLNEELHVWIKETYQWFICESAFTSLYKVPPKCTERAIRGNFSTVHIIWNWADKQSSCSLLGIIRIWLCAHTVILPVSLRFCFSFSSSCLLGLNLPLQITFFSPCKIYWSISVLTVNAIIRSCCKTSSGWFEQRKCKNYKNSKNVL